MNDAERKAREYRRAMGINHAEDDADEHAPAPVPRTETPIPGGEDIGRAATAELVGGESYFEVGQVVHCGVDEAKETFRAGWSAAIDFSQGSHETFESAWSAHCAPGVEHVGVFPVGEVKFTPAAPARCASQDEAHTCQRSDCNRRVSGPESFYCEEHLPDEQPDTDSSRTHDERTCINCMGIVLKGWTCKRCGVFNGEEKELRFSCRSCGLEKK